MRGFFGKKSESFKFEKIKKYEEKKFRKQTLQSFEKASLPKWRGGKYAGETDRLVIIIREKNIEFLEGKFDRIEI